MFLYKHKLGAKSILSQRCAPGARHALLSFELHLLGNKELGLIYKNILDAVFSSSGFLLSSCPPRLTQVSKNSLHLIRVSLVMIWQALLVLRCVPGEPAPLSTSGSFVAERGLRAGYGAGAGGGCLLIRLVAAASRFGDN